MYKELDFEYDKTRMTQEILSCSDLFFEIPPYEYWMDLAMKNKIPMVESLERYRSITFVKNEGIIRKEISPAKSLYFKSPKSEFKSYSESKLFDAESCVWNEKILDKISYTKEVIENLPFSKIGIVRVFLCKNTFIPTHDDKTKSLKNNIGISLVPVHSETPFIIFDRKSNRSYPVLSSSFIFDDSNLHGIPMVHGLRIDVRIFGDFKSDFV